VNIPKTSSSIIVHYKSTLPSHFLVTSEQITSKRKERNQIQEDIMSKGDQVEILDFWASPFCARVKIALEEKGVKHVDSEEDLFGAKSELLLKSNPIHQRVPVLLHNGKPIAESAIIVSYIDEVWPSKSLLPTCAYDRAQARFWVDYIDKKVSCLILTVC